MTPCRASNLVTSPDGTGVISLGCADDNIGKIYELREIDGKLAWQEMPQKLKFPRSSAVAFSVPDNFANCTK